MKLRHIIFTLLLSVLTFPTLAQDKRIDQFPPATVINSADLIPIFQNGVTKKITDSLFNAGNDTTKYQPKGSYLTASSTLNASKLTGTINDCTVGKLTFGVEAYDWNQADANSSVFDVSSYGNYTYFIMSGTNTQEGVTIATINGGVNGRQIILQYNDTNPFGLEIDSTASIHLSTHSYVMAKGYNITLIYYSGIWNEVSRNVTPSSGGSITGTPWASMGYLTSSSTLDASKLTGTINNCTIGKLTFGVEAYDWNQADANSSVFDVSSYGNYTYFIMSGTNTQEGVTIATINGGVNGRQIILQYNDTNPFGLEIDSTASIHLSTHSYVMAKGYNITLIYYSGIWNEVSRNVTPSSGGSITGTPWTSMGYLTSSSTLDASKLNSAPWTSMGYPRTATDSYPASPNIGDFSYDNNSTSLSYYNGGSWTPISSGSGAFPGFGTSSSTACVGNDSRLSNSRTASDVSAWAKASTKPTYTYSEVGAAPAGSYLTSSSTLDVSKLSSTPWTSAGYVTGTPWTSMGYPRTATDSYPAFPNIGDFSYDNNSTSLSYYNDGSWIPIADSNYAYKKAMSDAKYQPLGRQSSNITTFSCNLIGTDSVFNISGYANYSYFLVKPGADASHTRFIAHIIGGTTNGRQITLQYHDSTDQLFLVIKSGANLKLATTDNYIMHDQFVLTLIYYNGIWSEVSRATDPHLSGFAQTSQESGDTWPSSPNEGDIVVNEDNSNAFMLISGDWTQISSQFPGFGTSSFTACVGNDSRLSDSRYAKGTGTADVTTALRGNNTWVKTPRVMSVNGAHSSNPNQGDMDIDTENNNLYMYINSAWKTITHN